MGDLKEELTSRLSFSISISFFSCFFLLLTTTSSIAPPLPIAIQKIAADPIPPPPPPFPRPPPPVPFNFRGQSNAASFKPSIAAIVGVLTTIFSITFLLLLYAKHCKRGGNYPGGRRSPNSRGAHPSSAAAARKNSGIDRAVIESLPVFRFGSLRGQKEGLECAVCLNRFEPTEVLRLLPKCKHAFHVECVDTWLDAHSTCPLCRYRVDPEDILLVADSKILPQNEPVPPPPPLPPPDLGETMGYRRVSGRHSSAGERGTGFLQIVLEEPTGSGDPTSTRRSFDSTSRKKTTATVGCFDRHRKDGLLLPDGLSLDRKSFERRFGHRIVVGSQKQQQQQQQRWSDVQPSDLLYLRSEMIMSDSCRSVGGPSSSSSSSGAGSLSRGRPQRIIITDEDGNGRGVINGRSVSEITGMSRRTGNVSSHRQRQQEQEQRRQVGMVSRWLAWISQSRPPVRPTRTSTLEP